MLIAVALFAVMDSGLKALAATLPGLQVATLRAASSLPLILLLVLVRGKLATLKPVHWRVHVLRGVLGVVMLAAFAHALKSMPLANAYALFFVAPLMITVLAALLLKERVSLGRWGAIAFGFVGVLVILRPSSDGLTGTAGLLVLLAALAYAVSSVSVRMLANHDSIESMMFWLCALVMLFGGLLSAASWVPLDRSHLLPLAIVGVTGTAAQFAITYAFHQGEASVVAPFEYTALLWGAMIDWWLWGTFPDWVTWVGAAFLVASGIYLVRHERQHAEDPAAHP